MLFSYNWLQSFFSASAKGYGGPAEASREGGKKTLPKPEKLAEVLAMKAFEVKEVKKIKGDFVLDIDVLPNRASDCFSHLGIAREIAAILRFKIKDLRLKIKEDKDKKAKDFVAVEVKNKNACPRYTVRVITDVKVGLSPNWLQERLKICGLRPINNVVDITNYVMLETGQPLHAFDFEKLEGVNSKSKTKKIIVRFAKKGEKIITLDIEEYKLDEDILIIADSKEPLAIAGIKGGKKAEITKSTKNIVLESANFDRLTIRRASRKLNLKTDASLRFEHGISPNLTETAINRVAFLIQEIAKGKVAKGLVDIYPERTLPKRIKLDLNYVEKLLGVKIPFNEIKNILKRLEFRVVDVRHQQLHQQLLVDVPTRRLDVSLPEDLIEEIGRIYGYERIPVVFPIASLIPPKRNLEIFWEDMVKNILKEAGFTEVYNYSFISEDDAKVFGSLETAAKTGLVEVENPTSIDFKFLRPSLAPHLLKNLQKNQKYFKEPRSREISLRDEIRIFELGKIFRIINGRLKNGNYKEQKMLTGLLAGDAFYQTKGIVDLLLNKLGISNIWYAGPRSELRSTTGDAHQPTPEESNPAIWHPKKCAEIKVDNEEIGFLGEISPWVLDNFNIKGKVVLFDLNFEKLFRLASEETIYRPISRFPSAVRDVAVLVPRQVRFEEVLNKIETAGGPLVRDIDIFDIYEGEELPEGKKNLAFHIIYQAADRTLKSEEIDEIQNKIIKTLEQEPEWQVRR